VSPARQRPGTLYFIGVTTGASLINRVFPRWAALLGLGDARLVGVDLPVGAGAAALRPAIAAIAADRQAQGALVTTHKIAVAQHAADLFATLDPWARRLGEIGAIVRRDGRLAGHATDPVTSGLALDELVGADWWSLRPRAEALLLGAGGASLALAAGLLAREPGHRPSAIAIADVAEERLAHCRAHLAASPGADSVRFVHVAGADDSDRLVAELPPGSLIANGTGLGKDRPGSPLGDAVRFPDGGAVWEFNYRGDLRFLRQAEAQAAARQLTLGDGWRYFVHGWSHVVALAFGLALDAGLDRRLLAAADAVRPPP
jgi:shikimate 5-dehydrogenase